MPIRKSKESTIVLDKNREQVLLDCERALRRGNFKNIEVNKSAYRLIAVYKTLTIWGNIEITLIPDGERTSIQIKSTAAIDNIYALFRSPGNLISEAFISNLYD